MQNNSAILTVNFLHEIIENLAVLSYNYAKPTKNQWRPYDYPGRKKLLWDGENRRITNFEPANRFVKRAYRGKWDFEL